MNNKKISKKKSLIWAENKKQIAILAIAVVLFIIELTYSTFFVYIKEAETSFETILFLVRYVLLVLTIVLGIFLSWCYCAWLQKESRK